MNRVFVYSSAPIQRIVALFEISTILEDHPVRLWDKVKSHAGIDDKEFFSYFAGKSRGYAIGIENLIEFDTPVNPKEIFPGFVPPQSYYYIHESDTSATIMKDIWG
ncbi:MAG: hypothetical protein ABFC24_07010 [Methanoregulaceae archaeon]